MPITDLLDPDKIKSNLRTKRIGRKILVYNSTSSTQKIAAEYSKNKVNDGLVIFAEEQTEGKGRTDNKWHSNRFESILCSIILTENKLNAELLSLTCAVAVAEAIGKSANGKAKIKWPNDIILNSKKVAGILLESKTDSGGNTCIIGVGINCHQKMDSFPIELQPFATSIDIESHLISDRILLAKRLLTSIENWLEIAAQTSEKVIDQWNSLSIQLGHRVKLIYNGKEFSGNCIGIDPGKGLILQLDTGGVRMFDACHTSIAK
ncbi:MAG: biotin--[acetyl-CoA-carboxylase] ligase [Planctomycetes bacterium]|nr:biotin--[acetyl-CoA-carboxylase] ligase [Planctomycetota bacterium]MBL7143352.1 biotin--[acetyl-CoA-carboxylase] ligase [Phycisphaerae bacterium]